MVVARPHVSFGDPLDPDHIDLYELTVLFGTDFSRQGPSRLVLVLEQPSIDRIPAQPQCVAAGYPSRHRIVEGLTPSITGEGRRRSIEVVPLRERSGLRHNVEFIDVPPVGWRRRAEVTNLIPERTCRIRIAGRSITFQFDDATDAKRHIVRYAVAR